MAISVCPNHDLLAFSLASRTLPKNSFVSSGESVLSAMAAPPPKGTRRSVQSLATPNLAAVSATSANSR